MKILKQERIKGVELNSNEVYMLKELLNYAFHRLKKHKDTGLHGRVSLKSVQALREQLGIRVVDIKTFKANMGKLSKAKQKEFDKAFKNWGDDDDLMYEIQY